MTKSEFEDKWQGKIKTYRDWRENQQEIWNDLISIEKIDNKKEKEKEINENVYSSSNQ